VESERIVSQVKNVKVMSLASLEHEAVAMQAEGERKGKVGMVIVKRRAGRGMETEPIVILTAREMTKLLRMAEGIH